jgi:hypothetical protein
MALDTAEHLAATQMFIDERPVSIVLQRSARVTDSQGGWTKGAPAPRTAQVMRKVASGRVMDMQERVTEDGSVVVPTASLIGMPDVDIERYDTFVLDGVKHEVVWVSRLPEWRMQAEIVERG